MRPEGWSLWRQSQPPAVSLHQTDDNDWMIIDDVVDKDYQTLEAVNISNAVSSVLQLAGLSIVEICCLQQR